MLAAAGLSCLVRHSAPLDAGENIERRTPNTEHRISNRAFCIGRWAFDVIPVLMRFSLGE